MTLNDAIRELLADSSVDNPLTGWAAFLMMPNVLDRCIDSRDINTALYQMYKRQKINRVRVTLSHRPNKGGWGYYPIAREIQKND